jgi:hypothetical protein
MIKYKGDVCCFLYNKKRLKKREEMREGRRKVALSGYNLNIINVFANVHISSIIS